MHFLNSIAVVLGTAICTTTAIPGLILRDNPPSPPPREPLKKEANPVPLSEAFRKICTDGKNLGPDRASFDRQQAADAIHAFCSKRANFDVKIVPMISLGDTVDKKTGKNKAGGIDNSNEDNPRDRVAKNGIWLEVRYSNVSTESTGFFLAENVQGDAAKTQWCVDRFMPVLDGCHTDTTTAKYGGFMRYESGEYRLAGTLPMASAPFPPFSEGELWCVEKHKQEQSPTACICRYTSSLAQAQFKKPESKKCRDFVKKDILEPL